MSTIKKRDFKKYTPIKKIDELVDADGSPIEGSRPGSDDNEIETAPQQTSDEFASMAIQPSRMNRSGYRSVGIGEDDKAKEKMKDLVEDIVSNTVKKSDFVKKNISPDINRNGIPDIEDLAKTMGKPGPVRHAQIFVDDVKRTPLNGDEKAIIINYILSNFDLSDISNDYKNILRKFI